LDWHCSFYHSLDCLVILTYFECLYQVISNILEYSWTMWSKVVLFEIFVVSILPIELMKSTMKFSSSLLFLMIVQYLSWINFSIMEILTTREVWSDKYLSSGRMIWLSSLIEFGCRKHRLITEFELLLLSEYWMRTYCTGIKRVRLKESAISNRTSLWTKWKGYKMFQSLSLMLELPAMIKTLWRLASVFLRYFKAVWQLSE